MNANTYGNTATSHINDAMDFDMSGVANQAVNSYNLSALPDEIITSILALLDAKSTICMAETSTRFHPLASEALLWHKLCMQDWRFWDRKHDFRHGRNDRSGREWRKLYATHKAARDLTHERIKDMIENEWARMQFAEDILGCGYDAKDALLELIQNAKQSDCPLAQRYWARTLLDCLNRSVAIENWNRIRSTANVANPTELGIASLDMFILEESPTGDMDDVLQRLDEYVASIRSVYPNLDEQTPKTRAIVIAEYVRAQRWVGIDDERSYYALDNMFLGYAVHSKTRNSLPLLSAVIYTYICRQFGLRAAPIGYPLHVHALIQPPLANPPIDLDGDPLPPDHNGGLSTLTHLYMDPYRSIEPISPTFITQQLRFMVPHTSPAEVIQEYLSPASPASLLYRSARNILNSITSRTAAAQNAEIGISKNSAYYASLWAMCLFPLKPEEQPSYVASLTQHFLTYFPFDTYNYARYILPLTSSWPDASEYRNLIATITADDEEMRPPKYRNRERERAREETNRVIEEVKYSVGTVFVHKRRGYKACIWGWDPICRMSEHWIRGNMVDTLPRGRGQPFYNVLVNDGTTRYVAQENVDVLPPGEFTSEDVEKEFGWEVGRWFKSYDDSTGRFVSNVRGEYPED